jgi:cholesterol oxidase-like protein/FAD binding domain-containing protein
MSDNSTTPGAPQGFLDTDVYRDLIAKGNAVLAEQPPSAAAPPAVAGTPPNFPPGIPVTRVYYSNWALTIMAPFVWVATPATENDCVTLANWAAQQGWTLRPSGAQHSFAPLVIPNGGSANTLLVDTSALSSMSFAVSGGMPTATFGAGVTMDTATEFLEGQNNNGASAAPGYGFMNYPAPGCLTIGGMLAIGGHGTGGPQTDFQLNGCLSNLILSFRAIVSDSSGNYSVQVFDRTDPDADVMILHVGRAFITEATLRVVPNYYLQVENSYPAASLLFGTGSGSGSFQQLVQQYGRVEVIWYPFTDDPWVKCWSVQQSAIQPQTSGPYNYPLANRISLAASQAIAAGLHAFPSLTPAFNEVGLDTTKVVIAPDPGTLNGPSRDLLLYVKNTTLRVTAIGYAWQCNHNDIQPIVNAFWTQYTAMLSKYQNQNPALFPMNAPTEIRCTTADFVNDLPAGSLPPALSICRQADASLDTVCWIQSLSIAGTDEIYTFMQELEQFYIDNWGPNGKITNGTLRPEWSKGWAFTSNGPGTNAGIIQNTIPPLFDQPDAGTFARATATFAKYDVKRIYTDPLLDLLFPA